MGAPIEHDAVVLVERVRDGTLWRPSYPDQYDGPGGHVAMLHDIVREADGVPRWYFRGVEIANG